MDDKSYAYVCPYAATKNILCGKYQSSGNECETCGWVPEIAERRRKAIEEKYGKKDESHEQEKG